MMALALDPRFPLKMRIQAPRRKSRLGGAAVQTRRQLQTPFYEFEVTLKFQHRADAERFVGLASFVQGDTPMLFDGGGWGDIQEPIVIGYGDGTTTHFYVPRRNLLGASWVFFVNGTIVAASVVESSGLVIFASPPPLNSIITAKGRNIFRVMFDYDDDFMQTMSLILGGIRETDPIRLLEVA